MRSLLIVGSSGAEDDYVLQIVQMISCAVAASATVARSMNGTA